MSGTNAAQPTEMQTYWNGPAGEKWVRLQARLDAGLRPFADAMFGAAALTAGESVVDVGCGCGATTLEAARLVGRNGRALGADISAPMIERAKERARELGVTNAAFQCIDAEAEQIAEGAFDVLVSRFGVMFFSAPDRAFALLRRAIRPTGRLAFVCWQPVDRNPWLLLPTLAAMQHIEIQRPADPTAPGPFAFGDPERVRGILSSAGWGSVEYAPFERPIAVGGESLEEAVDFMMQMGPAAQALQEADDETRIRVRTSLADTMRPFERDGGVQMDSAAWIFTAKNVL